MTELVCGCPGAQTNAHSFDSLGPVPVKLGLLSVTVGLAMGWGSAHAKVASPDPVDLWLATSSAPWAKIPTVTGSF